MYWCRLSSVSVTHLLINQCAVWRDLRASDDADADEGGREGGKGACMDLTEIERADRMQMNKKRDLSGCGLEVQKLSLIGIINF